MGYYDEHTKVRYKGPVPKKRGYFFAGLIGVILGAMLVMISIKPLENQNQGNLSNRIANNAAIEDNLSSHDPIVQRQVAIDVDTNTTRIVQKTIGAVVGVTNIQSVSIWSGNGKNNSSHNKPEAVGTGSGVIYKKAGDKAFIVTDQHVVEGATKLEVSLNDGTKLPAKLLGSDIWTDLAVLEIDGGKVKEIAMFGDSDKLKIGEPVIAIGNPLGPTFSGSVTKGIISGLKRTIPIDINQDGVDDWQAEVLQTDAAINPGNSGGALINIDGQVIGINSMKIAQQSVEGIGLSIPINSAKPIINDLEKYGTVKRAYMGVDIKSVSEIPAYYQQEVLKLPSNVNYGAAVRQVVPGSPAALAELKTLDVIVEMDGKKINDVLELRKYLYQAKKAGNSLNVRFYRNGAIKSTVMKLTSGSSQ